MEQPAGKYFFDFLGKNMAVYDTTQCGSQTEVILHEKGNQWGF